MDMVTDHRLAALDFVRKRPRRRHQVAALIAAAPPSDDAVLPRACPYINQSDDRCGNLHSLTRIDQTFCVCLNNYQQCKTFHLLKREEREQHEQRLTCEQGEDHNHELQPAAIHPTPFAQGKPETQPQNQTHAVTITLDGQSLAQRQTKLARKRLAVRVNNPSTNSNTRHHTNPAAKAG